MWGCIAPNTPEVLLEGVHFERRDGDENKRSLRTKGVCGLRLDEK